MGDSVRFFHGVQEDNIHGFPLIHQVGDSITEAHQVGQPGPPLGESMLTTPDDSLLPPCAIVLFDHFPRDQEKAKQPVPPCVLLLALSEIGVTFAFFQSSGISPSCHNSAKIIESGLTVTFASSLSTHRCIPSVPMNMGMASVFKYCLT